MLVRDFPNKRIKGLLERIKNGLGWRYQQFVEPTIDLYGDIPSFVKYQYQNKNNTGSGSGRGGKNKESNTSNEVRSVLHS